MSEAQSWVGVMKVGTIGPGEMTSVTLGDLDIAVYNVDGSYYATSNICTHEYACLSNGHLDGDVVECPLHGAAFDVRTGRVVCEPATGNLRSFAVRIVEDDIQIAL